ncbi:MAG: hypothetical protein AAGA45_02885 [Verrucomicrobiota bacterium]
MTVHCRRGRTAATFKGAIRTSVRHSSRSIGYCRRRFSAVEAFDYLLNLERVTGNVLARVDDLLSNLVERLLGLPGDRSQLLLERGIGLFELVEFGGHLSQPLLQLNDLIAAFIQALGHGSVFTSPKCKIKRACSKQNPHQRKANG